MPFTFAHPAAAVPLRKALGRFGSLSALIIGSMVPDLPYFLRWYVYGLSSHNFGGLFYFCLPAGVLIYILFHGFLRRPLTQLLPASVAEHLRVAYPMRTPVLAVIVSTIVGAATHIVWDAFTHDTPPLARLLPFLSTTLFSIGTFDVPVYKLLQHLSTVLGLAILAFWIIRWHRAARPSGVGIQSGLTVAQKLCVLALFFISTIVGGAIALSRHAPISMDLNQLAVLTSVTVTSAVSSLGAVVLLYCAAWWCRVRYLAFASSR